MAQKNIIIQIGQNKKISIPKRQFILAIVIIAITSFLVLSFNFNYSKKQGISCGSTPYKPKAKEGEIQE